RAYRNNNPGNLTIDLTGTGIGFDGPFVKYATASDGWEALKKQVSKMIDGSSAYYNVSMTIAQIASIYTATQQTEWASNVASRLGVSPNTTLADLLTPTTIAIGGGAIIVLALLVYFLTKKKE